MIIKPPVGDYSYLPEDMRKEFIEVRKQIYLIKNLKLKKRD